MEVKKNSSTFIFVFLGMLTAFAPFVTDMYLPGLPIMAQEFNTSVSMVQMGLTCSMLGLAFGQLLFGPLSDRIGRRKPLIISMWLFVFSTLACIFAPTIQIFVALRLLQGIAASGGIVIARSIATDKFKKNNLAKALAIVGAINGIAPIAAPVVGGIMLDVIGWRGIFIILLAIGIIILGCCFNFKESLSTYRRSHKPLAQTLSLFTLVLSNKKYLFYTLEVSFVSAILFTYIATSPFIIQNHYNFSPFMFSLFFALNALAIGIGAAVSLKFSSPKSCLKISCVGMLLCSILITLTLNFGGPIWCFETLLVILCFMMGLSFTVATAAAMDAARANAGTASAILGAGGFLFGSVVSPLSGLGNLMVSASVCLLVAALGATYFVIQAIKTKEL